MFLSGYLNVNSGDLCAWYFCIHPQSFIINLDPMPAFKMKAKLVTCSIREGTCLHVCQKSSKISKSSCSHVRMSHEMAELDKSSTNFQNCEHPHFMFSHYKKPITIFSRAFCLLTNNFL